MFLQHLLHDNCRTMVDVLNEQFEVAVEFLMPKGGIFIWITLPEPKNTTELTQVALTEGVAINSGAEWFADPVMGHNRLRLCFASPSKQEIIDGVKALAKICHRETGLPERGANILQKIHNQTSCTFYIKLFLLFSKRFTNDSKIQRFFYGEYT